MGDEPIPPCRRCGIEHVPVSLAEWSWMVRDYKPNAPGKQPVVLWFLAARLDPRTGCGWISNRIAASDAGVSEDIVERATKWARDRFMLHRARKGGRVTENRVNQSLWFLMLPTQTRTSAGLDPHPNPHQRGVGAAGGGDPE